MMQSTYCTCVQLTYCTWCSRCIALVCSRRIVHGAHVTSTVYLQSLQLLKLLCAYRKSTVSQKSHVLHISASKLRLLKISAMRVTLKRSTHQISAFTFRSGLQCLIFVTICCRWPSSCYMPHRSAKICLIGRGSWVFKGLRCTLDYTWNSEHTHFSFPVQAVPYCELWRTVCNIGLPWQYD